MKTIENKETFLESSQNALSQMVDMLNELPSVKVSEFSPNDTVIVIVDMINGFAREGMLSSPRVNDLTPGITNLMEKFKGFPMIAFADCHTERSPEFGSYPIHCLEKTSESQVVDEIKAVGGYTLIPKNSTNGFAEPYYERWVIDNLKIKNFIVVGDCTDICISQFALSVKTDFNRRNVKDARIIVPTELVDTFDLGMHNADLMNVVSLVMMQGSGVELVKNIQ